MPSEGRERGAAEDPPETFRSVGSLAREVIAKVKRRSGYLRRRC